MASYLLRHLHQGCQRSRTSVMWLCGAYNSSAYDGGALTYETATSMRVELTSCATPADASRASANDRPWEDGMFAQAEQLPVD